MIKVFSVLIILIHINYHSQAQNSVPIKFGHINQNDFDISKLTVDTTSGAVILGEIGSTSFQGNDKGWFSLIIKYQCRIKIINKSAFELANVEIPLYVENDQEERLDKIKASTYNLENGQVVETKLNSNTVFKDKYDRNHIVRKFSLPAVKEGSIIEYSYTINSDYLFNLHPWTFQGSYPVVYSEYQTEIPEFFNYVTLTQGYLPFKNTETSSTETYNIRIQDMDFGKDEIVSLRGNTVDKKWVMINIPALKEEKFTSSIKNHVSRIEFQLAGMKFPDRPYRDVMGNWLTISNELLKDKDFGEDLSKNNGWLDDTLKSVTAGAGNNLEKAKKIYYYVKQNMKPSYDRGIWLTKSIKDVFKNKNGSVAEINLLLVTMLKHENIKADPVILSTTTHGYTNEIYPLLDRFNYIVCKVTIDSNSYFLDANESYLGFGKLPEYCFNGYARVIASSPDAAYFLPDTLAEKKTTFVTIFNLENKPGKLTGNFRSDLGYYESCNIRSAITDKGKDEYLKKLSAPYTGEYSLSDINLEDITELERPMKVNYTINVDEDTSADIIYFNPMIKEGYMLATI